MLTSQLLFHPRVHVSVCGDYAILYSKDNEIHILKIIGDGLVEDWSRSYHDGSLDNSVATAAKPSSSCCHRLAPASWSIQTLPREMELAHNDEEDEENLFKIDQHPGKSSLSERSREVPKTTMGHLAKPEERNDDQHFGEDSKERKQAREYLYFRGQEGVETAPAARFKTVMIVAEDDDGDAGRTQHHIQGPKRDKPTRFLAPSRLQNRCFGSPSDKYDSSSSVENTCIGNGQDEEYASAIAIVDDEETYGVNDDASTLATEYEYENEDDSSSCSSYSTSNTSLDTSVLSSTPLYDVDDEWRHHFNSYK